MQRQAALSDLQVASPDKSAVHVRRQRPTPYQSVCDERKRPVRGLWERTGRGYVQITSRLTRSWRCRTLIGTLVFLVLVTGCHDAVRMSSAPAEEWFPRVGVGRLAARPGVDFIPGLRGYQQTTDYTCGPAALLSVGRFYHQPGVGEDAVTELRIAREAGTRFPENLPAGGKLGTTPQEMLAWLQTNGYEATLEFEEKPRENGAALRRLRENIRQGLPTLVAWIDLGGHWAVVVGYDDRQNSDPWDDVLILADPYDRYDDVRDGYSYVNANRFYWMWFDVHHFDRETWRTMITVKSRQTSQLPQASQSAAPQPPPEAESR